ncbi:efflux RND transporter periplasmic adaptor subunit [Candidatus Gracilibacteria bacterium]|nr:efflux RND transporter periplasmic adaptor subunit [Candidatus Gracilibacteria bacterium]
MNRIFITILITTLFFLTSCGKAEINESKIYYSTGVVFTGTLDINNSYVGYVKGDKMVNLATKVGGKVSNIYVKEGDKVNKGQLLLKLDGSEAKVGYSSAGNIIDTLVSMKNYTKLMFDEQIKSMEAKVEQVKLGKNGLSTGLNDTKKITEAQLKTAKTGVEIAKANLKHTKSVLETKKSHIYDNMKSAIVGSVILNTNIIKFIDELLGVTEENKHKNDSFETYLAAKNTGLYNESKQKFREVNLVYLDYKKYYDENIDGKNPSNDVIFTALKKGEKTAEEIKSLLSITYDVLDASIDNVYFPATTINSYKNQISTFGTNIEASLLTVSGDYILGLKGSRQNLADFNNTYNMQIDLLEKQVKLAEDTLNKYIEMSKGQVNEVQTKSNVSVKQLDEILAGLESLKKQKESKLSEIDAKIDEAKGQLNSAGVMINNGKIVSPITGIVTKKMVEVGQVVGGGMPLLTVSNTDKLVIDVNVSEDVAKGLKLNDRVLLNIDGISKQVHGYISNINLSKDMITKKVGIEVTISENNGISIGSFTKVIFQNFSNSNKILISNDAIISKFMVPGVFIIDNGIIKFKNIKIINQNDKFSEVEGLKVGDEIIIKGKENLYDNQKLK